MKEMVISILAALISFGSAIFSFSQAKWANKSYKLQKMIYDDGKENIYLEINNSFLENINNKVRYFLEFNIINKSDKNNSIKDIYFKIENHDKSSIKIKGTKSEKNEHDFLKLPIYIEAHSSKKGCMVFDIDEKVFNELKIQTHYLEIIDINNNPYTVEEIFVKSGDLHG